MLCGVCCLVHCRVFSSISGLHPLDASSYFSTTVTPKNVSRQGPPGPDGPRLKATALYQEAVFDLSAPGFLRGVLGGSGGLFTCAPLPVLPSLSPSCGVHMWFDVVAPPSFHLLRPDSRSVHKAPLLVTAASSLSTGPEGKPSLPHGLTLVTAQASQCPSNPALLGL